METQTTQTLEQWKRDTADEIHRLAKDAPTILHRAELTSDNEAIDTAYYALNGLAATVEAHLTLATKERLQESLDMATKWHAVIAVKAAPPVSWYILYPGLHCMGHGNPAEAVVDAVVYGSKASKYTVRVKMKKEGASKPSVETDWETVYEQGGVATWKEGRKLAQVALADLASQIA